MNETQKKIYKFLKHLETIQDGRKFRNELKYIEFFDMFESVSKKQNKVDNYERRHNEISDSDWKIDQEEFEKRIKLED